MPARLAQCRRGRRLVRRPQDGVGADEHSGSLFAPNLVDGPMEGAVLSVQQDLGGGRSGQGAPLPPLPAAVADDGVPGGGPDVVALGRRRGGGRQGPRTVRVAAKDDPDRSGHADEQRVEARGDALKQTDAFLRLHRRSIFQKCHFP